MAERLLFCAFESDYDLQNAVESGLHNREVLSTTLESIETGSSIGYVVLNVVDKMVEFDSERGIYYALNVPNYCINNTRKKGLTERYMEKPPIGAYSVIMDSGLLFFEPEEGDSYFDFVVCVIESGVRDKESFHGAIVVDNEIRTMLGNINMGNIMKLGCM